MLWKPRQSDDAVAEEISQAFDLHPIVAKIISNRGISSVEEARKYLFGTVADLYSPFLLNDMQSAVDRIMQAVAQNEKIIIYGDYDVDGLTSICLLSGVISSLHGECGYYLPNRITEGYGISTEGISRCAKQHAKLIISVDCGINSRVEIEFARTLGIDVIVTDHHEPGENVPSGVAVINPKRKDSSYPFKNLAGIGVTFKLVEGIVQNAEKKGWIAPGDIDLEEMLDIVALGTVADVVPLLDENRILVKAGLSKLASTSKEGLKELKKLSNVDEGPIISYDIAFRLAPRLNAVGRLGSADIVLELLNSEDSREAFRLASVMEKNNSQRRKIEQEIFDEAMAIIAIDPEMEHNRAIVLYSKRWHQGVVGIVASRVAKAFYKPTIIIALEDDEGKGSARSTEEFHILDGIAECADLLKNFGGHKLAAGFTISVDKIGDFYRKFQEIARHRRSDENMVPKIKTDIEVELNEITRDLISKLRVLEPLGQGNPQPVFVSRNLFMRCAPRVVGHNHLKMWFEDKDRVVDAIGFAMADRLSQISNTKIPYDIAYLPKINTYRGESNIQLVIKDIRPSEGLQSNS